MSLAIRKALNKKWLHAQPDLLYSCACNQKTNPDSQADIQPGQAPHYPYIFPELA
jgi:hypothetical protein